MSDNLGSLSTPEEYINYYYPKVKDRLSSRGLQISKVGFIGFIINMMAFTQYDVKMYYDSLFREAFLATADNDENLNLHGTIFGYNPLLANPASITGNLKVNVNALPPALNIDSREISISGLKFKFDDLTFTLDSSYTIGSTSCEVRKKSGDVIYVPFNESTQLIPVVDLLQYVTSDINFILPYYLGGTFYQKIIELDDGYVYEISVKVKDVDSEEFIDYEVRYIKYFTSGTEKVVFARYLTGNKLLIEFGSGIHGKHISEASVKIQLKITQGKLGNISSNTVKPSNGNIRVYESNDNGGGSGFNVGAEDVITLEADYAEAGSDPLSGDDLRNDIIAYIQTRNNMLSETDFYNIMGNYVDDLLLMFKKTNIVENTIYTFLLFRDQYKIPVLSKSISVLHSEFNPNGDTFVYKPTIIIDNIEYISPFYYKFDSFMRDYPGYTYYEEYSTYFSKIDTHLESTETGYVDILPLSLYLEYMPGNNATRITVRSYQTISQYVMYINIPLLEVYECMDVYDDNIQEYMNINDDGGIIKDCIDIIIEVRSNDIQVLSYSVTDICLLGDISDILTLKIYEHPTSAWNICGDGGTGGVGGPFEYIAMESHILNIPVMRSEDYNSNQIYYDEKFVASFGSIGGDENRLISDDLQVRFLNTEIIPANILANLTVQEHNFDLTLPLKLKATVTAYKRQVLDEGIDTLDIVDDLKATLATKLYDNYTGTSVSFYRTQIVDIIHNLTWVKHCNVTVFDSSDPEIEIPEANFEMNSQIKIINSLDKLTAVTYCPVYTWWDLDNIEITLKFE